jgi:hypothetical protein
MCFAYPILTGNVEEERTTWENYVERRIILKWSLINRIWGFGVASCG